MEEHENLIAFPGGAAPEAQKAPAAGAPHETQPAAPRRALLLATDTGAYDAEKSLAELSALCEAYGLTVEGEVVQRRQKPDPATLMGAGRLAEAALLAQNLEAEVAVFDGELSGSQLRNLEGRLGIPVLDRTLLILEIFSRRAVTREGKTQTELATLEYRLPRLAGHGASLSRQGGGGAGGGGARRGGGETQLEYNRRYIRGRIAVLRERLAAMQQRRQQTRRTRRKSGVPLVALVGYTNVGKSSLVNALAGSEIPAADMLFATLDPTARKAALPDGQSVVFIDTVGFVSRLPHDLVEAFKSTLEEARYADVLLLVADAANPQAAQQLAVAEQVLGDIGIPADTPRLVVYNKCDLVPGFTAFDTRALAVSAATGQGLNALRAALAGALSARVRRLAVLLPYGKLSLADTLRRHGRVLAEEYREDGVYLEATVQAAHAGAFAPYLVPQGGARPGEE